MLKTQSLLYILLLFSVSSTQAFAETDWAFCYNSQKNRVYFQTESDIAQNKGQCLGRTYFQGDSGFHLIEDEKDDKGFAKGLPGVSMNIVMDSGQHILVSQWNNLTKNNTVIVLEPNHKNNNVKRHCTIKNYYNSFKTRINEKSGIFEVWVRQPKSTHSNKFHHVWKACFKTKK